MIRQAIRNAFWNLKYPNKTGITQPENKYWSGHGHFMRTSVLTANEVKKFTMPYHKVLDLGCGNGRTAFSLVDYLKDGYYEGVDISKEQVDFCKDNITSKYPNFNFTHIDVFNSFYNPTGKPFSKLPFKDGTFDTIVLTSVFTHMLPADVEIYLSEIKRVVKPTGTIYITYFILDSETAIAIKNKRASFSFRYGFKDYAVENIERKEYTVGYSIEYLLELYHRKGLSIKRIHNGTWAKDKPDTANFQDSIIAKPIL
jgi:SAM-dependent methyltransferase